MSHPGEPGRRLPLLGLPGIRGKPQAAHPTVRIDPATGGRPAVCHQVADGGPTPIPRATTQRGRLGRLAAAESARNADSAETQTRNPDQGEQLSDVLESFAYVRGGLAHNLVFTEGLKSEMKIPGLSNILFSAIGWGFPDIWLPLSGLKLVARRARQPRLGCGPVGTRSSYSPPRDSGPTSVRASQPWPLGSRTASNRL